MMIGDDATRTAGARDLAATMTGTDSPPTGDEGLPDRIGRFTILAELARGGMGVVYRAEDAQLEREVAVKVLAHRLAGRPDAVRRFLDEARVTGQLQHPDIPPVHEVGELPDGRPFLAMKLIKGRTLDELLKERADRSTDRGRFIAIFEHVCQALAYAHDHGVIHRDVKPANIMVGAFGEVQVMDWGLAKLLRAGPPPAGQPAGAAELTEIRTTRDSDGSFTQAGAILGTPAYMPPEQASGEADRVDRRADVFGLGAVLCAVLTGKPPYLGADAEAVRRMAVRGKLDEASARLDACGAEPELVVLAKQCLASEPEDRPVDAAEVARAVAAFRSGAEERARRAEIERAQAVVRAAEQRKRARTKWILTLTASVFAGVAGGALWFVNMLWERQKAAETARRTEIEELDREQRGEEARIRTAARQKIELALTRAESALTAERLAEADLALDQIDQLLPHAGVTALSERVASVRRDRDMVRKLNDIFEATWTVAPDVKWENLGRARVRYPRVFEEYGLRIDAASANQAAEAVRQSRIAGLLVDGLGQWFFDEPTRPGLRAVLDRIDPDPFRVEVRAAMMARDENRIRALAVKANGAELPPGFAVELGSHSALPPADALRIMRAAWEAHPQSFPLAQRIGNVLMWQGKARAEKALGWHRIAIALRPTSALAYRGLSFSLLNLGDVEGSIAAAKKALTHAPNYVPAYCALGDALEEKGDFAGAVAANRRALEIEPRSAFVYCRLGIALRKNGELDASFAALKQAIAIDPNYSFAHLCLGNHHENRNELDAALESYVTVVRINLKDAYAWYRMGRLLHQRRDFEGAANAFRTAIAITPTDPDYHDRLGEALRKLGRHAEAVTSYRRAVELDPKSAFFHHDLSQGLEAIGDLDGALAHCALAAELDPKESAYPSRSGRLLSKKGDHLAASREFRKALSRDPNDADACSQLGYALMLAGRNMEAVAVLAEGLRAHPAWLDDREAVVRYNAACGAARAAAGLGADAPAASERAGMRQRALDWLTAELVAWRAALGTGACLRSEVHSQMQHWLLDADLFYLRHPLAVGLLPANERDAWRTLWTQVHQLERETELELAPVPRPRG